MSTFLYRAHCPYHEDDTESMGIYADGHGHCYGCGWHGYPSPLPPPPEWHVRRQQMPMDRYDGPLPWSMVDAYVDVLNGPMAWRKQWLQGRGLRLMTIEKLRLGHTGRAFSIPIWGLNGKLETVKYRRDDRIGDEKDPKYKCLPGAEVTLYGGWQHLEHKIVLLCEGELDAARLMQELWLRSLDQRYAAVSFTGGCNSSSEAAARRLIGGDLVVVLYDQDEPGQDAAGKTHCYMGNKFHLGDKKRGQALLGGWPKEYGKDITEAINKVGFETWFKVIRQCW